jgi:hypothetical protein
MSVTDMYEVPRFIKCSACATQRPAESISEGRCKDTMWCDVQKATLDEVKYHDT